jgi:hypothetical protein
LSEYEEQGNAGAFAALTKAVYCPICGCTLKVEIQEGRKKLVCSRHGEMNAYISQKRNVGPGKEI